jgi:IclR family transcriptional regulator, pca regulon regulatory protein
MRVKRVESLIKGLETLHVFSNNPGGLKLPEVTRLTGLPKATAYRFLQTLVDQDYLHYFPEPGLFRLGPKVMSLGFATLRGFEIAELSQPYLEGLSKRINQNVNLGVLDGAEAVYLVRIKVRTIFNINLAVGSRVKAYNSAIGKALLAYLDEDRLHTVIDEIGRDPDAARTIGRRGKALKEHLRVVRDRGYALSDNEVVPGLASIAVPVFNAEGQVEEAINVPVFTQLCSVKELIETVLPLLRETAMIISRLRGYPVG